MKRKVSLQVMYREFRLLKWNHECKQKIPWSYLVNQVTRIGNTHYRVSVSLFLAVREVTV